MCPWGLIIHLTTNNATNILKYVSTDLNAQSTHVSVSENIITPGATEFSLN